MVLADSAIPIISVFDVAEEPFHAGIVQTRRLPRHALGEPHLLKSLPERELLVLPALVRVQDGRAFQDGFKPIEHLHRLGEVGASRRRPGNDLVVVEVHHRGGIRLAASHLELRDIGGELSHRVPGGEVAVQDVSGYPSLLPFVGAVALAPYPAAKPFFSHQLEHGLAADGEALPGLERHRYLAVSRAVGGAGEHLADKRARIGPPVGLGAPASRIAVVGALRKPELVEHELERVVAPQRVRRPCPISSAKALIRFWISSSNSSSRTRASSSPSREEKEGSFLLGLPLGLGRSASGPPSR